MCSFSVSPTGKLALWSGLLFAFPISAYQGQSTLSGNLSGPPIVDASSSRGFAIG